MSKITVREAQRLRRRIKCLEEQERLWRQKKAPEYWQGLDIATIKWEPNDPVPVAIRTANRLAHAVMVSARDDGTVRFIALPHPQQVIP